jgi:hypothetical protein
MFPPKLGGAFEAPLPFPEFVNLGGSDESREYRSKMPLA